MPLDIRLSMHNCVRCTPHHFGRPDEACGLERIYRINPATLAVESTPAAQSRDYNLAPDSQCIVSMAFVTDASSPSGETLYIHTLDNTAASASTAYRLGLVDPTTSAISDIAALTGAALLQSGDTTLLTGNSQGVLYAAFDAHPTLPVGLLRTELEWYKLAEPAGRAYEFHVELRDRNRCVGGRRERADRV
jgi:hypothetical protein